MGQIPLEIHLIPLAIHGMMQKSIGIMKDIPFGDLVVFIMFPESRQCPVCDVLSSDLCHPHRICRMENTAQLSRNHLS